MASFLIITDTLPTAELEGKTRRYYGEFLHHCGLTRAIQRSEKVVEVFGAIRNVILRLS
jgi:hypothetical protein